MNKVEIDQTKLPQVMEWIAQAAAILAERDCTAPETKQKLADLEGRLRQLTGNDRLNIRDFQRYWSYTSLETMAKKALMAPPAREESLTEEQIRQIVLSILHHSEAEMDWWLQYLRCNTGLDNLTDYIFYPDLVGLASNATLEQIAEQIIRDSKSFH